MFSKSSQNLYRTKGRAPVSVGSRLQEITEEYVYKLLAKALLRNNKFNESHCFNKIQTISTYQLFKEKLLKNNCNYVL